MTTTTLYLTASMPRHYVVIGADDRAWMIPTAPFGPVLRYLGHRSALQIAYVTDPEAAARAAAHLASQ